MKAKLYQLDGIGEVKFIKRRGNRNLRLSFGRDGLPQVSLPTWVSYAAALKFAGSRRDWIIKHRPAPAELMRPQQLIAGKFTLTFSVHTGSSRPQARMSGSSIVVHHPAHLGYEADEVQAAARRGALRALKQLAEQTLPPRLAELAKIHGYKYTSVKTKPLLRRWGSCDSLGNITLNTYLVQLPAEIVDYVILHELTHTHHQHHQAGFWDELRGNLPNADQLRRELKTAKTEII